MIRGEHSDKIKPYGAEKSVPYGLKLEGVIRLNHACVELKRFANLQLILLCSYLLDRYFSTWEVGILNNGQFALYLQKICPSNK